MFNKKAHRRGPSAAAAVEEDAFAQEALSHLDSLYGVAMRLTRRPSDAEDLVQETYLKAFRFSSSFERGTNLKAWLITILHNTWRNMRRHDRRDPIEVNSETVDRAATTAEHAETPEQILQLITWSRTKRPTTRSAAVARDRRAPRRGSSSDARRAAGVPGRCGT